MLPACIGNPDIGLTTYVFDGTADVKTYAFNAWSNKKYLTPLGIAKDGRIIWGPYDNNGNKWKACDVDVCNGLKVNGVYGYVATEFHPYFVGCWGPGNYPTVSQTCSANGRSCGTSVGSSQASILSNTFAFIGLVLMSIFVMY